MGRANTLSFEFCGVCSIDMGIRLLSAPTMHRSKRRGTALTALGRSGDLWQDEDAYDITKYKISCSSPFSRLDEIAAWLSRSGTLVFSHAPDREYRNVRITGEVQFSLLAPGNDLLYTFDIEFECQPFRYLRPAAGAIVLTENPSLLTNPGTAPAHPKIIIRGKGSFSLTVGLKTMFFTGIMDGIVVDSELMDALTLEEDLLLNNAVGGDFPILPTGAFYVTWQINEEDGGNVQSVTIEPRWRFV